MRLIFIPLIFALVAFGCSAKQAHATESTARQTGKAQHTSTGTTAALRSVGFYVYENPSDLSLTASIPALTGTALSLNDLTGNITLLNFWATWCPPCRAEMPSIERLYSQMSGTKFRIAAVNAGEQRAEVAAFIKNHGYTFPIYLDESNELSSVFAARGLPSTYLLNKEGKIIAVRVGAMEYDQAELIRILKELADG